MRHQKNKLVKKSQPRLKPVSRMLKASLVGLGIAHTSTQAATLVVTSNADNGSGGCTLREALDSVNAGSAIGGCMDVVPPLNNFGVQDTVLIPGTTFPNNTITLNGSELSVTESVIVNGFEGLVIDGDMRSRVIEVTNDADLILNNITISRGLGGIRINNSESSLRLNDCIVSNNNSEPFSGGGIDFIEGDSLILNNSQIINNEAGYFGGGIRIRNSAYAKITNSVIDNNTAQYAGGINAGDTDIVIIEGSSINGNTATAVFGGMSSLRSDLTIIDSVVSNNTASAAVGGLEIFGGSMTLINSSVSNNNAGDDYSTLGAGGGIRVRDGATIIAKQSTIIGNSATTSGGGIWSNSTSNVSNTIDLSNVTIVGNSSGESGGGIFAANTNMSLNNVTISENRANQNSGILVTSGGLTLTNTIIANSTGGSDCSITAGSINTDLASIVADGSCNTQRAIDPQLGPLADNGGNTLTMALKPNSPARNTGILATCETRDQRNQLRDDGDGACDVGAIEFNQNDDFGEEDSFFVIPLKNKKAVIVPL